MRACLVEFNNLYVEYLDLTVPLAGSGQRLPDRAAEIRGELMVRAAAAQDALNQAGVNLVRYPPPATGGPVVSGLANTMFVHETDYIPFGSVRPFHENVTQMLRLAVGYLTNQRDRAVKQRRSPLYWGDRVLTFLLGIPSYFVSRIFGVPVWRIEESPLGVVLRIIGLVVETLVLYVGGRELGWWG